MRGATTALWTLPRIVRFQSTLPMRGATSSSLLVGTMAHISIHAPHAGSDKEWKALNTHHTISIHAPHAGSDRPLAIVLLDAPDFNPRSPCGERQIEITLMVRILLFQSTLPMRGATITCGKCGSHDGISIHAPHAGSDKSQQNHSRYVRISIHAPHAGSDMC